MTDLSRHFAATVPTVTVRYRLGAAVGERSIPMGAAGALVLREKPEIAMAWAKGALADEPDIEVLSVEVSQ